MATEKVPPVRIAAKAALVECCEALCDAWCCEALRDALCCEALHEQVVQRREGVPALCEAQRCEALREVRVVLRREGVPALRKAQCCEALREREVQPNTVKVSPRVMMSSAVKPLVHQSMLSKLSR